MTQGAVLVVEDEVLVRLLIADTLRQSSFRVIEAANGYEARTVLQSGNPVAVLITDVKMPGLMDGLNLAKWIRAEDPAVKIILVSGSMAGISAGCSILGRRGVYKTLCRRGAGEARVGVDAERRCPSGR